MSVANKLLQAAAGGASDPVYVEDVFSTFLYKGNNTSRNIVNGIDLADKGGLVWTKNRVDLFDPVLVDSTRGLTNSRWIRSNTTEAQGTDAQGITAFNNNGYTVGTSYAYNAGNQSHVSWTFAKQSKFFDIVTYTGDGTDNRAIAHNLGSVPGMILVKVTSTTDNWIVYHRSLGYTKLLRLNSDGDEWTQDRWGDQNPTSTQFYVDNNQECNQSSETYVAYLFAHNEQEFGEDSDEAITHCGSLTLTSGNVTNVNVGFEPQWLLIKKYSADQSWMIFDNMRGLVSAYDGDSQTSKVLNPNTNAVESNLQAAPLATGFALDANNWGTGNYVYMAIARPNKPASELTATDLFTLQAQSPGEGADTSITTGFNVDTFIYRSRASSATVIGDRLRGQHGGGDILTNSADSEGTNAGAFFLDQSNGVTVDFAGGHFNVSPAATDKNYIRYFLRRAKGFYDVVSYKSNGSAATHSHNLGVVPELMFIKNRSGSADQWVIWDKNADLSTSTPLFSDFTQARRYNRLSINSTAPTASVFSSGAAGYSTGTNGETYIVYLFASVDGISKVGTYTGTGNDVNVDCGFSAGARFVLIWRTDGSGPGWYIFDSARGIVAGNDPYILMGSNAAEVTNTDYIDPLSSGFTVTSSAPTALNINNGTYTFLAIA